MSLLTIAELEPPELERLVRLAGEVKASPERGRGALDGRSVGLFSMKPSLRTLVSSEVAVAQLGGHPVVMSGAQVGLGSRESPEDVGRVLARYLDLVAMRVFDHADLESVRAAATIPVVNLLSDREHPCQALADLVTIEERRGVTGSTVAYVGDANNVCRSLVLAVAMARGRVRVASPPGHGLDESTLERASRFGPVDLVEEPEKAVEGADVVYTDVWTSMGQEAEADRRRSLFSPYQVDLALFERAAPDATFLHCLPAHRGEEVTDEVVDHPRSAVYDQAENRLHAFKAVLLHLLR